MSDIKNFLQSDGGKLAQYNRRVARRVTIHTNTIEPQSKNMSEAGRDKLQEMVLEHLSLFRRAYFKGDIALSLNLSTTTDNPPHAHTIAKNILDLLAARRGSVKGSSRYLLYKDDSQIQALSVSCRHGESQPKISIGARPFRDFLNDLELAQDIVREFEMSNMEISYQEDQELEKISSYKDLQRKEREYRMKLGDDLYESYLKVSRWWAQRALLGRSTVSIPSLCFLYNRPYSDFGYGSGEFWAELSKESKIRLSVGELPIKTGSSKEFRERIGDEIRKFKEMWSWIIDPLVVAVGLEVIVRPNPSTPSEVLHDLDNVVRNYLLPQIVPSFGTVSDHRWTIDFEELRKSNKELAEMWGPNPTPPVGSKAGVTRYEIWRIPAVKDTEGFVSVALVADVDGEGGLFDQIDERIRSKGSGRRPRRRW